MVKLKSWWATHKSPKLEKRKKNEKVRFVFEMPREQVEEFVNGVIRTDDFSVRLSEEELDKISEIVRDSEKNEVVFSYGDK